MVWANLCRIYGKTVYDVRVPLALPDGGLKEGYYYHYILNIKSRGNGTNDPSEATDDKDEIDTINLPIIVSVTVNDYQKGIETILDI